MLEVLWRSGLKTVYSDDLMALFKQKIDQVRSKKTSGLKVSYFLHPL